MCVRRLDSLTAESVFVEYWHQHSHPDLRKVFSKVC